MNITAGEFAAMNEEQRTVLTFEILSSIDKSVAALAEDMAGVKKCVQEGKLTDRNNENAVRKAQAAGDEGVRIAIAANRRIDRIIWAGLVLSVTTLASLIIAILGYLIQKGMKI